MDLSGAAKDRWGIVPGVDPGTMDFMASGKGRCGERDAAGLSPPAWPSFEPT